MQYSFNVILSQFQYHHKTKRKRHLLFT